MDATGNDLFSQLTPEQISALLQGGTLQDKGTLLQQQLDALLGSGMQHQEHSSPLGAGLGGIGEALDGAANAFHAKALRGQQQQNIDAQGKLMGDFGALLRPQQAAAAPGPMQGTEVTPEWGIDLTQPQAPGHEGLTQRTDPTRGTQVTPEWGLDLSAPPDANANINRVMSQAIDGAQLPAIPDEPGVTRFPTVQKPIPPASAQTEIVDDGSDGWGLDLSHPGQVEAMAKALRGTPSSPMLASRKPAQSIHPGMPQRRNARLLEDEELSPFGY